MPERFFDCIFFFLRAVRLLGILRLWKIIVLPFDDPAFPFDLRNIQVCYVQSSLLFHIIPDLLIGRLTALVLHQFFHIYINVDMSDRISQN